MKRWIAVCFVLLFSLLLCGCSNTNAYVFDEENMRLVQFEAPSDDQPAVLMETNMGDIYIVLYPDEAAVACENFQALVEQGWYDGTEFFQIESNTACVAGSQTPDGSTVTTIYNEKKFENEYTSNMWPFSGAMGTISDEEGMSDSRFFLIGDVPCSEEYVETMESYDFPQAVIEKFEEVGGIPPFTQRYTFFGQVVLGMDVVNNIIDLPVDDHQYPTGGAVVIEKATLITCADIPNA